MKSVSASLSTRQLVRIARRLAMYSGDNIYDVIQKACLGRFVINIFIYIISLKPLSHLHKFNTLMFQYLHDWSESQQPLVRGKKLTIINDDDADEYGWS